MAGSVTKGLVSTSARHKWNVEITIGHLFFNMVIVKFDAFFVGYKLTELS